MRAYALNDFTGGLNDTVALDSLKANELVTADNVIVFQYGGIETRPGTTKLNSTSFGYEIDQDIMWKISDGSYMHLVMMNNALYKVDDTAGTATLKKTLSSSTIGYVMFEDKLFFVDGADYFVYGFYKFTSLSGSSAVVANDIVRNLGSSGGGTVKHYYKALSNLGTIDLGTANYADTTKWLDVTDSGVPDDIRSVPSDGKGVVSGNDLTKIKKCTIMEYYPNAYRVFASGNPDEPGTLYYMEINNPYAHLGSAQLVPTSGTGPITGLQAFTDALLVSYQWKWMYWKGVTVGSDVVWKTLPIPTGCINHWAKVNTPYSLTFWGQDGLYIIYPSILITDMTVVATTNMYTKIDENRVRVAFKSMQNPSRVRLTYQGRNLWIAYGTTTGRNDNVLVFNWEMKSFVKFTGWQVNDWHIAIDGNLWFASKNYILKYGGAVYNDVDVATGSEKAIAVKATLPPLKLSNTTNTDSFIMKQLHNVYVAAKQYVTVTETADMNITVDSDYATLAAQAGTNESLSWGTEYGRKWGFVELVVQRMICERPGFRHAVALESNKLNNHWYLYSLGFEFDYLDGTESTVVNNPQTSWITD